MVRASLPSAPGRSCAPAHHHRPNGPIIFFIRKPAYRFQLARKDQEDESLTPLRRLRLSDDAGTMQLPAERSPERPFAIGKQKRDPNRSSGRVCIASPKSPKNSDSSDDFGMLP